MPANIRSLRALEGENHHLRGEVPVNKSRKAPVGAAAGNYRKIQIKHISNLIPSYISAEISKLLISSNYLIPYCKVGSTYLVSDADDTWPGTWRWRCYYAMWMNPDDEKLVLVTRSYSSSKIHDLVTSLRYCRRLWVGICVVGQLSFATTTMVNP